MIRGSRPQSGQGQCCRTDILGTHGSGNVGTPGSSTKGHGEVMSSHDPRAINHRLIEHLLIFVQKLLDDIVATTLLQIVTANVTFTQQNQKE